LSAKQQQALSVQHEENIEVATPDTGDEPDGNNVPNIGEFEVPKPENFPKLYKITVTDWTTQRPKADIMV
jgi:hypothetical protein